MSNENVLKKQFEQKDVQRLRNIIQKKYGDKIATGVGYTKKQEFHSEGDVWEEDGYKWTIKNGIKQNITKLDKAKKLHILPLFCPSCNKIMNNPYDKDYYKIHKKCFNCVAEFETELRRTGKWEEYQKSIHNSEIDNYITTFKVWVDEQLNTSNDSFISEQGDKETWIGGPNKDLILNSVDETVKYLEGLKK
jgi:hypothetical protein